MERAKVQDYLVGQEIRSFWEKTIQYRPGFSRILYGNIEIIKNYDSHFSGWMERARIRNLPWPCSSGPKGKP